MSGAAASAGGAPSAEGAAAEIIGVIGAGTMGAGIAQLAARSGALTLLYDALPDALERGLQRAREGLALEAAKGRLSEQDAHDAAERLHAATDLSALAPCELVIEAAPERLELKHEIYGSLERVLGPDCVLATNTSSLPVTAVAAALQDPGRAAGMHFFNPAPVMPLVEVIAGERSRERAVELVAATGRAMGKTVIRAADVPGFIVNRCNRPFGLEGLRVLGERIADIETIDTIVRMEGAFRMGPFELMDLVGVDTGFEVSKSFYELSFGEPRWRPSPISARYAAAGLHGRKSGRGYYDYSAGSHRPADPDPPEDDAAVGLVVIGGESAIGRELGEVAAAAGYEVRAPHEPLGDAIPVLFIDCSLLAAEERPEPARRRGAHLQLCAASPLSALDPAGTAVGFHVLPPFDSARLVELTRGRAASDAVAARATRFFATLGRHTAWVGDAPGLVLGRIVCQLVNESAFALGEGVGSAADIDLGMVLGLSHPRGPLAWADMIGLDHVLAVLDGLQAEYREERYRAAPELRRLVRAGRIGGGRAPGFHDEGA